MIQANKHNIKVGQKIDKQVKSEWWTNAVLWSPVEV